jgi:hypothetical protein
VPSGSTCHHVIGRRRSPGLTPFARCSAVHDQDLLERTSAERSRRTERAGRLRRPWHHRCASLQGGRRMVEPIMGDDEGPYLLANAGSIARWIAEQVGDTGYVLAVDLDPRWCRPERGQRRRREHPAHSARTRPDRHWRERVRGHRPRRHRLPRFRRPTRPRCAPASSPRGSHPRTYTTSSRSWPTPGPSSDPAF